MLSRGLPAHLELYQNAQTLTHPACRPTVTSIAKRTVVQWDIGAESEARTVPRMSQCLRSLVLQEARAGGRVRVSIRRRQHVEAAAAGRLALLRPRRGDGRSASRRAVAQRDAA